MVQPPTPTQSSSLTTGDRQKIRDEEFKNPFMNYNVVLGEIFWLFVIKQTFHASYVILLFHLLMTNAPHVKNTSMSAVALTSLVQPTFGFISVATLHGQIVL